ncbi:O-antigen ligase family protein [Prevotella sp. A2931]|uniref:O-antigen ligase family protein n=2 Tax=Prevotellaceae TaxID=171552 RepID=A0ABS3M3X1_9BACT|nr:O-antigen ligase family protein [Prevotella illustrans]
MATILSIILLGQSFLNFHWLNIETNERYYGMRALVGLHLLVFSAILQFDRLFHKEKKNRILKYIQFLIVLSAIIFVCQTRSINSSIIICLSVYLIVRIYQNRRKWTNAIVIFIVIISIPYSVIQLYDYIYNTVSTSLSANEASSIQRLYAYHYYWTLFLQHPFVGIGLQEGSLNILSYDGIQNRLYIADVGVVGFVASFGILGIIVYSYLIAKYGSILKHNPKPLFFAILTIIVILAPFNALTNFSDQLILLVFCFSLMDKQETRKPRKNKSHKFHAHQHHHTNL